MEIKKINLQNNQEGQVLLLLLLVMGFSLMVGLSLSSRSLSALKQSGASTESLVCMNNAEAGVEDALQTLSDTSRLDTLTYCNSARLSDGSWADSSHADGLDSGMVVCDLQGNVCGGRDLFTSANYDVAYCIFKAQGDLNFNNLSQDEAFQISLRTEPSGSLLKSIDLFWTGSAVPKFTVFRTFDNPEGGLMSENLDVGAFDPVLSDSCNLNGSNDPTASAGENGGTVINIALPGYDAGKTNEKLNLRLRFLCDDAGEVKITGRPCVGLNCSTDTVALPTYAYTIRSLCLNQPVVREVEATKWPPTLPSIFDLGLYSGSTDEPLGD